MAEVGVLAQRVLRSRRRGRIAAVFERSLYAVLDDDWICIGSRELGSGPLHILCEGITPSGFSPGQELSIRDAMLVVGGVTFAGIDTAPVWVPGPPPGWTPDSLRTGIAAADEVWRIGPAEEGLAASGCAQFCAPPSRVVAAAAPGLAALKRLIEVGLDGHRSASLGDAEIAQLIGLGPGLTPSGDDLLGGALVALTGLGFTAARDALWKACQPHLGCTNEISAAHLRSAALGCAASVLHEAIDATIGGRVDRVAAAIAAVSAVGHCSGRDAFAGALIVFRVVERWTRRRETMRHCWLAASTAPRPAAAFSR
ncbi:MAG: DUF2877 domain-containing protein [Bradyrhizobium sp.]|nr:DUF2877 domain-containing protein [Bradyrhizobium sp.]